MDAVVTFKASPAELDVIRAALQDRIDVLTVVQSPSSGHAITARSAARTEIVKASDILAKLK